MLFSDRRTKWISIFAFLSLCLAVYGYVTQEKKESKPELSLELPVNEPNKSIDPSFTEEAAPENHFVQVKSESNSSIEKQKRRTLASEESQSQKIKEEILENKPVSTPLISEAKKPDNKAFELSPVEDLLMGIKFGFGGRYINSRQSGAFGGMKNSFLSFNEFSIENKITYGRYSIITGYERMSALFSASTTNTSSKEEKIFSQLYITPGIDIFYSGLKFQNGPIMYADGTTILWSDLTATSVLLGLRAEKVYAGQIKKPFKMGFDLNTSYLVSAQGSSTITFSSPKGFGLSLQGYLEKTIQKNEKYDLNIGFEPGLSYEQFSAEGSWNSSVGTVDQTVIHVFSRIYLGINF